MQGASSRSVDLFKKTIIVIEQSPSIAVYVHRELQVIPWLLVEEIDHAFQHEKKFEI